MKIISYTLNAHSYRVTPAPEMFDVKSKTRVFLAENGVIFKNDAEVLAWIIAKDVPKGVQYKIEETPGG